MLTSFHSILFADLAPPEPKIPTLYPEAFQSIIAGLILTGAVVVAGFLFFRRSSGWMRRVVPVLLLAIGLGATAAIGYAVHKQKTSAVWRAYNREKSDRPRGGRRYSREWDLGIASPPSEDSASAETP